MGGSGAPNSRALQIEDRLDDGRVVGRDWLEAKSLGYGPHGQVFLQHLSHNSVQSFLSGYMDKPAQEFRPQTTILISVGDYDRDLSVVRSVELG